MDGTLSKGKKIRKKAINKMLMAFNGDPVGIRTLDLLIRSQSLYPAELPSHKLVVPDDLYIITKNRGFVNEVSKKSLMFLEERRSLGELHWLKSLRDFVVRPGFKALWQMIGDETGK